MTNLERFARSLPGRKMDQVFGLDVEAWLVEQEQKKESSAILTTAHDEQL